MMMMTIMIVSSVARLDIEIHRAKHNQECPVSSHLIVGVSALARPGLGDKVTLWSPQSFCGNFNIKQLGVNLGLERCLNYSTWMF